MTSVGPEKKMWGPVCRTRGDGSRSKTEQKEPETGAELFSKLKESQKATERKKKKIRKMYSFKGGDEESDFAKIEVVVVGRGWKNDPGLKNKHERRKRVPLTSPHLSFRTLHLFPGGRERVQEQTGPGFCLFDQ